jgi:hypothetical protein
MSNCIDQSFGHPPSDIQITNSKTNSISAMNKVVACKIQATDAQIGNIAANDIVVENIIGENAVFTNLTVINPILQPQPICFLVWTTQTWSTFYGYIQPYINTTITYGFSPIPVLPIYIDPTVPKVITGIAPVDINMLRFIGTDATNRSVVTLDGSVFDGSASVSLQLNAVNIDFRCMNGPNCLTTPNVGVIVNLENSSITSETLSFCTMNTGVNVAVRLCNSELSAAVNSYIFNLNNASRCDIYNVTNSSVGNSIVDGLGGLGSGVMNVYQDPTSTTGTSPLNPSATSITYSLVLV